MSLIIASKTCKRCGSSPIHSRGLCKKCYLKGYYRGAFKGKQKNCPNCNVIMPSLKHTCPSCGFNIYPSKKRNCPRCGLVEFRRVPNSPNYHLCSVCKEWAYSQRTKKMILYRITLDCPTCGTKTLFKKIPHGDYLACEICTIRYSPSYGKFFQKGQSPFHVKGNRAWRRRKTREARQKVANLTTNGIIICYDFHNGFGKEIVKRGNKTYIYSGCKGRMEFHEIHGIPHETEPSYVLNHLSDFIQLCHAHHNKRHTLGIMFGAY